MTAGPHATSLAPPLISLSIVSHGDGAELSRLLESLEEHEGTDSIQVVVTDNLGDDLADLSAGGWHSVTMLRPSRPLGFAQNHNRAFERAAGKYFCVLNPDVMFVGSTFAPLIAHLQGGGADLVAPVIRDTSGQVQDSFRALPTPMRLIVRRMHGEPTQAIPLSGELLRPDWVAGTFMLMQSETFAILGGFDARYRLYFEDVDLCTRARLGGMKIGVDPTVQVRHDPRRASRRAGPHMLWHLQSALRFFTSGVYRRARLEGRHG